MTAAGNQGAAGLSALSLSFSDYCKVEVSVRQELGVLPMVSTRAAVVERHLRSPAGSGTRRGQQAQESWPRGGRHAGPGDVLPRSRAPLQREKTAFSTCWKTAEQSL